MSDNSDILGLPYIQPGQDQKHVTHNEAIEMLDLLVQANVAYIGNTPPGSNAAGDRYIVGTAPTGAWTGHNGQIARWDGVAWQYTSPQEGWLVWVKDVEALYVRKFTSWEVATSTTVGASQDLAQSPNGAKMTFTILEEELTGLSGANVDSTIEIPNGAIVYNVSERVTTSITGATSFSVGVAGNTGQFGSGLGIAAGGTNLGVIGPTAFYADTPIRLTSAGGSFTGGAVRIAICFYMPTAPQS